MVKVICFYFRNDRKPYCREIVNILILEYCFHLNHNIILNVQKCYYICDSTTHYQYTALCTCVRDPKIVGYLTNGTFVSRVYTS